MKPPNSPIPNGGPPPSSSLSRRAFHRRLAAAAGAALTVPSSLDLIGAPPPRGKAKSCIMLWLGGGMCHVDTLDPKPVGDPATNRAGSAYSAIATAIPGVKVCEHLAQTARLLDRGSIIRTLNHALKVDHADSTNLVKTGRLTSGTVVYPSIGSLITHELGPRESGIPPYVVMGMPNVTRGPGFLGSQDSYVYLTDTEAGPDGLRRPADVTEVRQRRRNALLDELRATSLSRSGERRELADYNASISAARNLMNGAFPRVFRLDRESSSTRSRYGGEFGQRCLLARRLVESGARFVEAAYSLNFKNGTGWDTHRHGQKNQHLLIRDLDQALSALIEDLEKRGLLQETLVVVATEFGRPPEFDGQGGRNHQSAAFSVALFGGGLQGGRVVGETDALGHKPVSMPVSVPDLHATILAAMGVDHAKDLHDGDRPIPITDHGTPIARLFG